MKNLTTSISCLFLAIALNAQNERLPDFLANLVAPLDKSQVVSGYLWDKGTNGFAEPSVFDGVLRDSNFLQPITFGFLYAQARNSNVAGVNILPPPQTYMNYIQGRPASDTVPLVSLALCYQRLLKSAFDNNLVVFGRCWPP